MKTALSKIDINKYLLPLSVFILLTVFVITVLIVGISNNFSEQFNSNQNVYQAVFLNNNSGQVYFGKITKQTGSHIELENVFYPKNSRQIQPDYSLPSVEPREVSEDEEANSPDQNTSDVQSEEAARQISQSREQSFLGSQPRQQGAAAFGTTNNGELRVVKLGGELHRPGNRMIIPLTSVLFIQDIQPDSYLARTIASNS